MVEKDATPLITPTASGGGDEGWVTYALPMLLVSNVPVKLLVDKLGSPLEILLLVTLATLICIASEIIWRTALKRYTSASS